MLKVAVMALQRRNCHRKRKPIYLKRKTASLADEFSCSSYFSCLCVRVKSVLLSEFEYGRMKSVWAQEEGSARLVGRVVQE